MDEMIGIVTPALNVAPYLPRTAESVWGQTHARWRWIIVDNGSGDGTAELAGSYAQQDSRITVLSEAVRGIGSARNAALAVLPAEVRYVAFMDADDVYTPDALASMLEYLRRYPEAVGVHAVADYIDAEGKPYRPGEFAKFCRERHRLEGTRAVPAGADDPTTMATVLMKAFHPPGVFLLRREVVDRVGRFDLACTPSEDWDYWIRAARYGDFRFLDKLVLGYRRHESNASSDYSRTYRVGHYVRSKSYYAPENTPEQRAVMRRTFLAWQRLKISEKATSIAAGLRQGELLYATRMAAHVMAHSLLYLRGKPAVIRR